MTHKGTLFAAFMPIHNVLELNSQQNLVSSMIVRMIPCFMHRKAYGHAFKYQDSESSHASMKSIAELAA